MTIDDLHRIDWQRPLPAILGDLSLEQCRAIVDDDRLGMMFAIHLLSPRSAEGAPQEFETNLPSLTIALNRLRLLVSTRSLMLQGHVEVDRWPATLADDDLGLRFRVTASGLAYFEELERKAKQEGETIQ